MDFELELEYPSVPRIFYTFSLLREYTEHMIGCTDRLHIRMPHFRNYGTDFDEIWYWRSILNVEQMKFWFLSVYYFIYVSCRTPKMLHDISNRDNFTIILCNMIMYGTIQPYRK
jgi:hypothetical protein